MAVNLDPDSIFDINNEHASQIMRKIIRNDDLRDLVIIAGVDHVKCVDYSRVDEPFHNALTNGTLSLGTDMQFIA